MTLVQENVQDATQGVCVAETPESLSAIHWPGCAAAVWHRQPGPSFQAWIDTLDPAQLPRARVILRPAAVHDAASQICAVSGTPQGRIATGWSRISPRWQTASVARWVPNGCVCGSTW